MAVSRVGNVTSDETCKNTPASGYTVKPGDTMSAIARAFNIPLADLIKASPQITNPNRIYPGDVVRLPAPGTTSTEAMAPEPRRAPGSGMTGVSGLAPQTFLGAKGV